jgi:hypothetical protein
MLTVPDTSDTMARIRYSQDISGLLVGYRPTAGAGPGRLLSGGPHPQGLPERRA